MNRAIAVAALTLAACSSSPSSPSPSSASSPAGAVPLPGAWRPVTGLPASTGVRVAVDPAASVAPLAWRACASGRAGCEVFVAEGATGDPHRFWPTGLEPVFEDDRGVHLSYLRRDRGARHTLAVLQRLHGPAEAAWWSIDGDGLAAAVGSRHGAALRVVMPRDVDPPHYLGASSPGEAMTVTAASLDPGTPVSQDLARGRGFVVVEATDGAGELRAAAFELDRRAFVGGDPDAAPLERPLPVDDGFVALAATEPSTIVHVALDGTRRTLVQPSPGARITGVALDRAAGDALVWSEQSIDGLGPPTLWTGAPARQVATMAARGGFVVNAGVVAYVVDADRARLVRLSDGATWDVAREPDVAWVRPLWVNADAAWFLVSDVLPGQPGAGAIAGVVRVARD